MNLHFNNGHDYEKFKEEIKERLRKRDKVKAEKSGYTPSAVLILLMNKNNEAHVFLTKRTDNVRTHKGQVSFPGGAREREDKTILETALRETYEETGIKLRDIEILGEFDEYLSISHFHVSTFIGCINYPYKYKINAYEIEDHFEAPLSVFCNKEYEKLEYFQYEGKESEVYHYSYSGFMIWGLTARILTEFACKVINE